MNSYHQLSHLASQSYELPTANAELEQDDNSLDVLLSQRSGILSTKLDVFMIELLERMNLRTKNLDRIDHDECSVRNLISDFHQTTGGYAQDGKERFGLYRQLLDIEKERRDQDVECWRDLVTVMRDVLSAWEESESSKSKMRMLQDE